MTTAPWLRDDVVEAARSILGWRVTSTIDGARVVAIIDEVEAYEGEQDPASHAYRGETPRNRVMFGAPGGLYVYRSYGIHWCMNVAVGQVGLARAVLLRGAKIITGQDIAVERRGRADNLANGPGKLTQALGVTGSMDGHRVDEPPLVIDSAGRSPVSVEATPRIGISKAVERPWRFVATF
ncbi:MAG: DNA-3-methyladenine glycosylase [Acidimicrobiia bacterium]|nr:DNA-3-methyladenine glycosylase [Acidimicrobiia bacterium]